MVYKFFDKKPQLVVLIMKLNEISNWLKNYTTHLLKNLKKEESSFEDNIWGADLADM